MYIGQTTRTIEIRWNEHIRDSYSPKNKSYTSILHYAIRKYGKDAFVVSEIEICDNKDLNKREKYWIKKYQTCENGYNISRGGGGWMKFSDDDLLNLWNSGMTVKDISHELNSCIDTISRRLKCLDVQPQEIVKRGNQSA